MMKNIQINGVDLCYEIFGENNYETIVLISGLGSQMIRWENTFCELLVEKGFKVIRFDNRDSGSTVFTPEKEINFNENIQEFFSSIKPEEIPYSLMDMAKDVIALFDYLQIEKAHFVGRSMGGIISQLLGSYFPERVLSLNIIMSTSLNPTLPPSSSEIMTMMMKPPINPEINREGFINEKLFFAEKISGNKFKFDKNSEIKMIEEELKRSETKNGIFRQLLAMGTFQYDIEMLEKIKAPTLVIHGNQDPIFHSDCGKDIADSIPNSEFILIDGMGHSIPPELSEYIMEKIIRNTNT
ncbi:alpha/beta fold hydrolase [Chryseobacterium sp. RG1]|uniref:Alpha/beta fold hydrolase n=1 Tax=Chryseobacterium tagetis TaxID=2801334 RepID=A0ABS8A5P2_9FLAO|nr:alpha/beta hydrolase [Chryseobacterium tagetis]MCA6068648.1 alpha/beta fold hydrolase [Chryseobacterium tagetis]